MAHFMTPVSMKTTVTQYNRDLREPLKKLGYLEEDMVRSHAWQYLMTNYKGGNDRLGILGVDSSEEDDQYYIEEYNPELFLALAAMRTGEKVSIGEYLKNSDGKIFKVRVIFYGHNDSGHGYLSEDYLPSCFNFPTKEEIIEHLKDVKVKGNIIELPDIFAVYCKTENRTIADFYDISYSVKGCWLQIREGKLVCHHSENNFTMNSGKAELPVATQEEVLNHIKMKKENRFPFQLARKDAKRIITIACGDWKNRLMEIWSLLVTEDSVTITEDFYKEMRKACDEKQHELFDEIFGKDNKDPICGTPCLVSNNTTHYAFRYADGKGKFFDSGLGGATSPHLNHIVLDNDITIQIVD